MHLIVGESTTKSSYRIEDKDEEEEVQDDAAFTSAQQQVASPQLLPTSLPFTISLTQETFNHIEQILSEVLVDNTRL